jgi:hypothetical protein
VRERNGIRGVDFQQVTGDDFERALVEHIYGPDNAPGWGALARCSGTFAGEVMAISKRLGIDPQVAAQLVAIGINVGYILRRNVENKRVVLV